jgi:hypothetical protein
MTAIGVPICVLVAVEPFLVDGERRTAFLADGERRRATPYYAVDSGMVREMQFLWILGRVGKMP